MLAHEAGRRPCAICRHCQDNRAARLARWGRIHTRDQMAPHLLALPPHLHWPQLDARQVSERNQTSPAARQKRHQIASAWHSMRHVRRGQVCLMAAAPNYNHSSCHTNCHTSRQAPPQCICSEAGSSLRGTRRSTSCRRLPCVSSTTILHPARHGNQAAEFQRLAIMTRSSPSMAQQCSSPGRRPHSHAQHHQPPTLTAAHLTAHLSNIV